MPSWSQDPNAYCVLLWLRGWTLDTRTKYLMGLVLIFCMGLANEWLSQYRRRYQGHTTDEGPSVQTKNMIQSALYGLQMVVAYLMMLVVMTYEPFLFAALVLGLTVGHYLFNSPQPVVGRSSAEKDGLLQASNPAELRTGSPCCGGSTLS